MARTSPVHYIEPSAISITPNANNSHRDLAVYVTKDAKIKVLCPRAGIGYSADGAYQEWTFSGRNRRLTDATGTIPYTIYARLNKTGGRTGYLVFVKKVQHDNNWIDAYSSLTNDTADGYSVLYTDGGSEVRVTSPDYYYVRLGDVSASENGQRTVTLDTGILGTDQFNDEWALNPDLLPLRIGLACTINNKDAGPTPYVYWGQQLVLSATLTEGWSGTDIQRFDHWEITRNSGDPVADDLWNHPAGAGSYRTLSSDGRIALSHTRGVADDFNGAVSSIFTVIAMGYPESSESSDSSDSSSSSSSAEPELVTLKAATINIHAETVERYELALSANIVGYNPQTQTFDPDAVTVRVRATTQRGDVFELTIGQFAGAGLAVEYAAVGADVWTPLAFSGASMDTAMASLVTATAFAAQQSLNVRLVRIKETDSSSSDSSSSDGAEVIELMQQTIAFVRDGEDSKEREWIFYRSTEAVTFGTEQGQVAPPSVISGGQVNPAGAATGSDTDKDQDGWVPQGWYDEMQGTDADNSYEYGSYRDYVHESDSSSSDSSSSDSGGHWGPFSMPKIWSHFGKDGLPGRGIKTSTELYQATNSSVSRQAPTSDGGWDSDPNLPNLTNKWTETYKYLWNCEKIVYTNPDGTETTEYTVPRILAIWTKNGDAGRGIDSITNYYRISDQSAGITRPQTDGASPWDDDPMAPTEAQPYLWNYEKITWLNYGSGQQYTYTDPHVIGHFGKDAPDMGENILLRTIFDRGIDFMKEAWAATLGSAVGAGYWNNISIDDTHTVEGRSSAKIDATSLQSGDETIYRELVQNVKGKLVAGAWYTLSFWACANQGWKTYIYNAENASVISMVASMIADGAAVHNYVNGKVDWGSSTGMVKHTLTFKTKSNLSTEDIKIIFRAFGGGYVCLCMPKLEPGKDATTYTPHEDDQKGEQGPAGDDAVIYYLTTDIQSVTRFVDGTYNSLPTIKGWKKVGNDEPIALEDIPGVNGIGSADGMTITVKQMHGSTLVYTNQSVGTGHLTLSSIHNATVDRLDVSMTKNSKIYASMTIPVIDEKMGKTGPMYYPAGEYDEDTNNEFAKTDETCPVVLSAGDYYYLKKDSNLKDGNRIPPTGNEFSSTYWGMASNFQMVFIKVLFALFANLGSFVISGDWFISQYGTLVGPGTNNTVDIDSTNMETLYGINNDTITPNPQSGGKVGYTWFDDSDPECETAFTNEHPMRFVPALAIDAKSGDIIAKKAKIKGHVEATSGSFGRIRIENGAIKSEDDKFIIDENGARFSGALDGATGTFSGELRAATGIFKGGLRAPYISDIPDGPGSTIQESYKFITLPAQSCVFVTDSLPATYEIPSPLPEYNGLEVRIARLYSSYSHTITIVIKGQVVQAHNGNRLTTQSQTYSTTLPKGKEIILRCQATSNVAQWSWVNSRDFA